MTTIYVMRHGDAISQAATDAERPLSERGKAEVDSMVTHLLVSPPAVVWVSPYLRAQQTAEIVISRLLERGLRPEQETVAGITPDDSPYAAVDMLEAVRQGPLLLVSHNPLVSSLVSLLTAGHNQPQLAMATASVSCLSAESIGMGTMDLEWYRQPG